MADMVEETRKAKIVMLVALILCLALALAILDLLSISARNIKEVYAKLGVPQIVEANLDCGKLPYFHREKDGHISVPLLWDSIEEERSVRLIARIKREIEKKEKVKFTTVILVLDTNRDGQQYGSAVEFMTEGQFREQQKKLRYDRKKQRERDFQHLSEGELV